MTALFVTTAATTVYAQSSVTISGQVDIGLVNPIGPDKTRIDQSGNGANQIAFSGSEDLGGGLRAIFRLSERFSPESGLNDGTNGNRPLFQGETTVGIAGDSFGTLRLGRAITALRGPIDNTDPWATFQQASVAVNATGYASAPDASTNGAASGSGAARTDGIHYTSPNFSGFTLALTFGPRDTQVSGVVARGNQNLASGWLQFANGPVVVGGGVEENRIGDRISAIQASYNFGPAKVGATYSLINLASTTLDRKAYNIGVTAPLGAITLKAGYGHSKLEGADPSIKRVGLGVDYALSKRTLVYLSVGRNTGTDVVTGPKSGGDFGVRHTF